MSDSTYETLYKRLRLHFPELPVTLAQEFINTAYSEALASSDWSGLRKFSGFNLDAPVSIDVTAATGDTTMTGTLLNLYIGKEIVIDGKGPFYTILSSPGAGTVVVDKPFLGESGTYTSSIQSIYLTVPSDFRNFISVIDPINRWRLHTYFVSEDLDRLDALRVVSQTPYILAGTSPHPSSGLPRYELWPRPGDARHYPFAYTRRPPLLSASSDAPITPIRGDVIRDGAMARLALWPGTNQLKNPFYDMNQFATFRQLFKDGLAVCQKEDQDLAQTMVSYFTAIPWAPIDAAFLQAHGGWPLIP